MPTANDFFGEDFSSPVATVAPVAEKPQSVLDKALNFFGINFAADETTKKPIPQKAVSSSPTYKFDTVFNNLISQESGGVHSTSGILTTSPVGAKGLTQVMPKTGVDPGYGVEPLKDQSEKEYKRFGRDYLKAMLTEFDGDYHKALAAYNAGVGSVKKAITKGGDNWMDFLPKKSETIPYINNILGKK